MYIIKYLYYNFYKIHKAMSGKKAGPEDGSDNFASWATGLPLLPNVITTQMLFHKITGIDIRDTMFPFDIFVGVLSLILIIYLQHIPMKMLLKNCWMMSVCKMENMVPLGLNVWYLVFFSEKLILL